MSEHIFELSGVEHRYPGAGPDAASLRGADLRVRTGNVTALLGRNGAGKSTILLHLNGLLRPVRGEVRFQGRSLDYGRSGLRELRRRVAVVFQNPDDQLFAASLGEDVSFGPLNLGVSEAETRERVAWGLEAVGLAGLESRPTAMLSFGQKKRAVLAGALAMRPEVLILDEPFAGLDPEGASALADLLAGLNREGVSVVLATHEADRALALAHEVAIIDAGRVLTQGAARSVLADAGLMSAAGLEVPLLLRVWRCLRQQGVVSPQTLPPSTVTELESLLRNTGNV